MVKIDPKINVDEMKAHAEDVVTSYSKRDSDLFARYREMYFMTDENKRPQDSTVDPRDWAITISPASRNEVTGMVRLLDTSEIHIAVTEEGEKAHNGNMIERALKTMLRVSGEYRRSRIESDAALSAVLYGPVVLYADSVAEMKSVAGKNPYKARQVEEIEKKTPFLIRSINPEQSYPEWGDYGMVSHVWKYSVNGSALKDRWNVEAKADKIYTVYDVYDCENRLVYCDEIRGVIYAKPHGFGSVPIVSRYAGGSSLFAKPEEQLGSFLYAKAKSRLDKRENAMLTAIATAINTRGLLGPLFAVDPENTQDINVNFTGGIRYILAKAQQLDDRVIDPVVFQWRQMLKELSGESTIHEQTLGAVTNSGTFSGLAMLSSAGKLPLVDSQRAIEMAFRDIFLNILHRIKADGIDNSLIPPSEIPNDIDITVTLEPNLPQDKLRNSQVAQSLGDLVSDEWKHTNLLQVPDSDAMRRQVTKEILLKAIIGGIVQDKNIMQQMIGTVLGTSQNGKPPEMGTSQNGIPSDVGAGMGEMGAAGMSPADMTGMEQMPQQDPMMMPQERRM